MKLLRAVLFLLLLGAAIAICWKYHTAAPPMHAEDGYLSAEQAVLQLEAMGIPPNEYAAGQLKAAAAGDTELLRILVAAQPGNIVQDKNTHNTPLHLGAQAGHRAVCERLAAQHNAVDRTNKRGQTPLHLAAEAGHTDCVKLLISKGARINKYDVDGYTPLLYAVEAGHTACADALLQAGASRLARTAEGKTLAQLAEAHPEMEALLDQPTETPQPTPADAAQNPPSTILLPTEDLFSGKPLAEAIRQKNTEQVVQLLQEGLNVHYREHDKTPLVVLAAQTQQPKILEHLLSAGADPEAAAANGDKALHVAATNGDTETLQILINHRADVNSQVNGTGALTKAILAGKKECAELLLQAGANANEVTANGSTPLIHSIKTGNTAIVGILLAHGANANTTHQDKTPLSIAVEVGQVACVELLLKAGADATEVPAHKRTPLHMAAANNAVACIPLLLQAKAHIDAQDQNSDTPLHYAARHGHTESLLALLQNGANANIKNNRSYAPIHLVTEKGADACIPPLKHAGADMNNTLPNGDTPLLIAVKNGYNKCVTALITAGADIHATTPQGDTPLSLARKLHHHSCAKTLAACILIENGITVFDNAALMKSIGENAPETLRMLLEAGAAPHEETLHMAAALPDSTALDLLLAASGKADITTEPLLHTAAQAGSVAGIKTLLRYNADLHQKNKVGKTPITLARESGKSAALNLLENAQKLEERGYTPNTYNTALISMAEKGDHINLSRLIDVGANVNYADEKGNTALHAAATVKTVTCTRKLLEAGANPNIFNKEQKTPLMLAAKYGLSTTVRALIKANADVNLIKGSDSAATEAINFEQTECLQILLDNGANVNGEDSLHRSLLYLAVIKNNLKIMQILLERGATPNVEYAGTPLLFEVIKINNPQALQLLLSCSELNIHCRNQSGESPLHVATQYDNIAALGLLIRAGLHADTRNAKGQTIAHYAALKGHADLLKQMIIAGIPVNLPDNKGRTPLYYAGQIGHINAMKLLEAATGEKFEDMSDTKEN